MGSNWEVKNKGSFTIIIKMIYVDFRIWHIGSYSSKEFESGFNQFPTFQIQAILVFIQNADFNLINQEN